MNSKLVLVSALAAGVLTTAGIAQTASPQAPATHATAPAAPPPPQAIPAKVAFIELEEVAAATNEGQKAVADIQKKYQPQKDKLDALKTEIDTLTKQLQSAPATMSDEEKASRARDIDTKQKQLQRDADDAQTSYNSDTSELYEVCASSASRCSCFCFVSMSRAREAFSSSLMVAGALCSCLVKVSISVLSASSLSFCG